MSDDNWWFHYPEPKPPKPKYKQKKLNPVKNPGWLAEKVLLFERLNVLNKQKIIKLEAIASAADAITSTLGAAPLDQTVNHAQLQTAVEEYRVWFTYTHDEIKEVETKLQKAHQAWKRQ